MDLAFEFPGLSGQDFTIVLPIHDGDVIVNWNGTTINYTAVTLGVVTHTFTNIDPTTRYNVQITSGTFTEFGVAADVDSSFNYTYFFEGCNYLTSVTFTSAALPNLASLTGGFANTPALTSVSGTFPSTITNLTCCFNDTGFLGSADISLWNVTNVTSMAGMFNKCQHFDCNLSSWNVSNVTDMSYMFAYTDAFNNGGNPQMFQPGITLKANMTGMFANALAFNRPIGNWDVSDVTNMSYMFRNNKLFNQSLSSWDVSNVTDMSFMFALTDAFNNGGNTQMFQPGITLKANMTCMFNSALAFNTPIGNWNVSNVVNMNGLFSQATSFNQPLNNWNVSNVTEMSYLFSQATSFNQPLNNWDVSNVRDMSAMFNTTILFNQPLNNWYVSNVTGMRAMFYGASLFNQNLGNWNISGLLFLHHDKYSFYSDSLSFFLDNSGLSTANYNATLIGWASNPSHMPSVKKDPHLPPLPYVLLIDVINLVYSGPQAIAARQFLIDMFHFRFNGDILGKDICYDESTKIFVYDDALQRSRYIPIRECKLGQKVKTFKHGYKRIKYIYVSDVQNDPSSWESSMFVLPKQGNMIDNLFITGKHGVLVNKFSKANQNAYVMDDNNKPICVDGLFVMHAGCSHLCKQVKEIKTYTIYHLVLENEDDLDKQYAIWANGVLSESLSEKAYLALCRLPKPNMNKNMNKNISTPIKHLSNKKIDMPIYKRM